MDRATKSWLEQNNIHVFLRPAQPPDFNLIENPWKLYSRGWDPFLSFTIKLDAYKEKLGKTNGEASCKQLDAASLMKTVAHWVDAQTMLDLFEHIKVVLLSTKITLVLYN